MRHARHPTFSAMSNHELGERLAMDVDAISAGRTFQNPQDLFSLKALLWEAATRLHRDCPGEIVETEAT